MTAEDELLELRAENRAQQEQIRVQQEQLAKQDELIAQLQQRIQVLEERLAKNSRNSHLPASWDRFVREPKSLRTKSGKKPGGQEGHPGSTWMVQSCPDEVIVHRVERSQHCQQDLTQTTPSTVERRQVFDLPPPRLLVREHQAEHKHSASLASGSRSPPLPKRSEPRCSRDQRLGREESLWCNSRCFPWRAPAR